MNLFKQDIKQLEAAMIGGPALLLAFFSLPHRPYHECHVSSCSRNRQPDMIITGHQWWWEVEYPGMACRYRQ